MVRPPRAMPAWGAAQRGAGRKGGRRAGGAAWPAPGRGPSLAAGKGGRARARARAHWSAGSLSSSSMRNGSSERSAGVPTWGRAAARGAVVRGVGARGRRQRLALARGGARGAHRAADLHTRALHELGALNHLGRLAVARSGGWCGAVGAGTQPAARSAAPRYECRRTRTRAGLTMRICAVAMVKCAQIATSTSRGCFNERPLVPALRGDSRNLEPC